MAGFARLEMMDRVWENPAIGRPKRAMTRNNLKNRDMFPPLSSASLKAVDHPFKGGKGAGTCHGKEWGNKKRKSSKKQIVL
jgi:hypothetical protein